MATAAGLESLRVLDSCSKPLVLAGHCHYCCKAMVPALPLFWLRRSIAAVVGGRCFGFSLASFYFAVEWD